MFDQLRRRRVWRFELPFCYRLARYAFFDDHFTTFEMAEPQVRFSVDKNVPSHSEDLKVDTHQVAERGHAATDM